MRLAIFLLLSLGMLAPMGWAQSCLVVSSYHVGYTWSDRVIRAVEQGLADQCEVTFFHMDTKRHKAKEFAQAQALAAKQLIDETTPDVVIALDDNASKYLVMPYLKDTATPVVFAGVNWTVEAYGYPYTNATGMIEVAPLRDLLAIGQEAMSDAQSLGYLAVDNLTTRKEITETTKEAAKLGMDVVPYYAATMAEWQAQLAAAQAAHEVVIVGNNAGIEDWDESIAHDAVHTQPSALLLTYYRWMMPYAMYGLTKIPEEQGKWAAEVAAQVLAGTSIARIPLVSNRESDRWIHLQLLEEAGIRMPLYLRQSAQQVDVVE